MLPHHTSRPSSSNRHWLERNPQPHTCYCGEALKELWPRVPRYKPLSVGVLLLDLVPAVQHQSGFIRYRQPNRQKLSPMIDRINDRYAIGFGLLPPDVRAFKGHAAFHRVPEKWEF